MQFAFNQSVYRPERAERVLGISKSNIFSESELDKWFSWRIWPDRDPPDQDFSKPWPNLTCALWVSPPRHASFDSGQILHNHTSASVCMPSHYKVDSICYPGLSNSVMWIRNWISCLIIQKYERSGMDIVFNVIMQINQEISHIIRSKNKLFRWWDNHVLCRCLSASTVHVVGRLQRTVAVNLNVTLGEGTNVLRCVASNQHGWISISVSLSCLIRTRTLVWLRIIEWMLLKPSKCWFNSTRDSHKMSHWIRIRHRLVWTLTS